MQTDRHTERCARTHYHTACAIGKYLHIFDEYLYKVPWNIIVIVLFFLSKFQDFAVDVKFLNLLRLIGVRTQTSKPIDISYQFARGRHSTDLHTVLTLSTITVQSVTFRLHAFKRHWPTSSHASATNKSLFSAHPSSRQFVRCPSVNISISRATYDSLLSGGISMKLRTNIHHVSAHCWKVFRVRCKRWRP